MAGPQSRRLRKKQVGSVTNNAPATIAAGKPSQSLTPSTKKKSATSAHTKLVRRKTETVAPQIAIGGMSSQDFNAP